MTQPGTSQGLSKLRIWMIVLAVVNVIWIINFGIITADALGRYAETYDWRIPLLNEITGAYSAFLVLPLLYLLWRVLPLTRKTWWRRLPLYLSATVLAGVLHTVLMLVSRDLLYPLFGLGEHDPGKLIFRFAMEFQKQVFWIWATFGLLALIRHLRTYHDNQIRSIRLQEQLVQSRMDAMRQQINPHFLFNTLNLISSKVYENAEEADLLITELADLLRVSLELGRENTVPLGREIEFLDKYVHIMRERFGDRFEWIKNIDPACLDIHIPSLILQPVLENSFKHRLEADSARLCVSIEVKFSAERLQIAIIDESPTSLVAVDGGGDDRAEGLGLSNVRSRLETHYNGNATFSYGPSNDRQFRVIMELPTTSDTDHG